jgi:hypothetical protein
MPDSSEDKSGENSDSGNESERRSSGSARKPVESEAEIDSSESSSVPESDDSDFDVKGRSKKAAPNPAAGKGIKLGKESKKRLKSSSDEIRNVFPMPRLYEPVQAK